MAKSLGAESLRYLPVEAIARATGFQVNQLCQGCITGSYPTEWGQQLYQIALSNRENDGQRTYESISSSIRS
jgi:amidophosphoribosyltransferase